MTRHRPYATNLARLLVFASDLRHRVDGHRTLCEAAHKIAEMILQVVSSNGWAEQVAKEAVEILTTEPKILTTQ